jgi:hypothetical protein
MERAVAEAAIRVEGPGKTQMPLPRTIALAAVR